MKAKDLNHDELSELKVAYWDEKSYEKTGLGASYYEIVDIDSFVSDDEIYEMFKDVEFVSDDFFCNCANY